MRELTQARLKELFSYDEETGLFIRLTTRSNAIAGSVAGYLQKKGYLCIRIDYKLYFCHRLAWLYVHGHFPAHQIDHVNCIKSDNRIANLREATNGENRQNIRAPQACTTSGFLGVSFNKEKSKFEANIRLNRKQVKLGYFDTAELAHAAYLEAKSRLHPFSTIHLPSAAA